LRASISPTTTKQNIDTDQIIPAEYLTLVPSKVRYAREHSCPRPLDQSRHRRRRLIESAPAAQIQNSPAPKTQNHAPPPTTSQKCSQPDEYEKLGSYALIGLPDDLYPTRYVTPGETKTPYTIVVGGENFGCGSSREHAPVALGAAGAVAVVAQSYARIFFRNCIATGEMYPVETADGVRLCDVLRTGDDVVLDLEADVLTVQGTGATYALKPIGDAGPVIDAGGIFDYARKEGMIKAAA